MEKKLIGLLGKKRSGKDTVSDYLTKEHNYHRYSFAGPLKNAVKEMFLMDDEQVDGENKEILDERWGISPRRLLQIIGTELFHYDIHQHTNENEFDIGREIWVKRFELWYKENKEKKVVVSDVRFEHEVNKIREMGGEIWKIDRPDIKSHDEHASEKEMDTIVPDELIKNDSSIDSLYEKVGFLISGYDFHEKYVKNGPIFKR